MVNYHNRFINNYFLPAIRAKQEPKSVHVASRTNFYSLKETKSMNAQVKFPFGLRSTAFCRFRVRRRFRFVAFAFNKRLRRVSFVSSRRRFVTFAFRFVL